MRQELASKQVKVTEKAREVNMLRRNPLLAKMAGLTIPPEMQSLLEAPPSPAFAKAASTTPAPRQSARRRVFSDKVPIMSPPPALIEAHSHASSAEAATDTEADALEAGDFRGKNELLQ